VASPARKSTGEASGSVHEEARPRFPCLAQVKHPLKLKRIDAGSTNCPLIQLIPSINYSVRKHTYRISSNIEAGSQIQAGSLIEAGEV